MSRIQKKKKIIHHSKKQKNLTLNEKKTMIDAKTGKLKRLELFDNAFKAAIV